MKQFRNIDSISFVNNSLRETTRFLLELHKETSRLVHGYQISADDGTEWIPFEATHFVFSYFVFNSIYSQFDWKKSIKKNAYVAHSENAGERPQIQKLLDLLSKHSTRKLFSEMVFMQLEGLHLALSKVNGSQLLSSPLQLWDPHSLNAIGPDYDIEGNVHPLGVTWPEIESAVKAWQNLFLEDTSETQPSYKDDLIALHMLIYKIRCNIFHGRKKLVDMSDPDQRDRLTIYTAIILATNELFLKNLDLRDVSCI